MRRTDRAALVGWEKKRMAYVAKLIGPDERLIGVTRLHWIYVAIGASWFLGLAAAGAVIEYYLWQFFGSNTAIFNSNIFGLQFDAQSYMILKLCLGAGLVVMISCTIKYLATELALTSRRLIYKTGLIFVEIEEIELGEIKGERIHHGLLGRLLGYGSLNLDCQFIGDVALPAIRRPYRFIKAVHQVRSRLMDTKNAIVPPAGTGTPPASVPQFKDDPGLQKAHPHYEDYLE